LITEFKRGGIGGFEMLQAARASHSAQHLNRPARDPRYRSDALLAPARATLYALAIFGRGLGADLAFGLSNFFDHDR
jgi:hypothetical protein